MRIASKVFWLPKDAGFAAEYEDAYAIAEDRGIAAIADGVASAMFSGQWARILTAAIISSPPNLNDSDDFRDWLNQRRSSWQTVVGGLSLDYFQREKMRQAGGAFSTLLWLECLLEKQEGTGGESETNWRAFATGDCGLFHVRNGQVLAVFPITKPEELEETPLTIGSVNAQKDYLLEFRLAEGICQAGDLFALCTDALLGWALRKQEVGESPDWEKYWSYTSDEWTKEIISLRDNRPNLPGIPWIRFDDTTLLLLRVELSSGKHESDTALGDVIKHTEPLSAEEGRPIGQKRLASQASECEPQENAPPDSARQTSESNEKVPVDSGSAAALDEQDNHGVTAHES